MKRRYRLFMLLLGILNLAPALFLGQEQRIAIIVDKAGVTTQVTNLSFRTGAAWWDNVVDSSRILFVTSDFISIAIPIRSLISIEKKESTAQIIYQVGGSEETITGSLGSGSLEGKSEFGSYELSLWDIKTLTFNRPPVINAKPQTFKAEAIIVLANGTRVSVAKLQRHDRTRGSLGFYSDILREDFSFLRGNSVITVEFSNLKSIEFGPADSVTVTSKSGTIADGKMDYVRASNIMGWVGVSEKGEIEISPKLVRLIEFSK